MIGRFSLSHYRFTLTPETCISMPRFNKGNVLRGAFGSSLRRIVCTIPEGVCHECLLKERCAYTLIFNPIGLSPAKRLQNPPRGFVLKPPPGEEREYLPERPLSFDMVLIGDRMNYLSYLIVTLIELGKVGIGLNRGRFTIRDIRILKDGASEPIYESDKGLVRNIHKPVTGNELIEYAKGMNPNRVTLSFLTPTRIRYNPTGEKGKSNVVRVPEFHHIIRRLRDRVNALSATYCGGSMDADFKGMAERAMTVKAREVNLRWVERKRRSRTQETIHDQSGFTGSITFEGDLSEFLPLILLGEYIHVGEDAVFGNGWYQLV